VDADALALLPAAVARDRDFDRSVVRRQHSPQGRRASVADGYVVTESEDRRHAASFEGEPPVAHRVNPSMKTV
jgi:hypothetical protein